MSLPIPRREAGAARGALRAPALVLLVILSTGARPAAAQIEVTEATVRELQEAMASGRTTSAEITAAYLARIEAYDQQGPALNAVIRVNPRALAEARALDAERATRGPRGPLHGIPVLLKDNYDTADMPTTAGTIALAGSQPADDAFQVRKLRAAGAVILGKTNMHELAYGITTIGSLGGQTRNPYDLARNPGGSSGGTGAAVAASFAALGWGSDTCGSIRIPASHNNLVGLRPTKGLSSIDGIVPLAHTQDVAGPLARSIEDLAIALDATVGADPADPATRALEGRELPRFVDALDPGALAGARIGILDALFGDAGEDAEVARVVREAIGRMAELGADTVPVEIPDLEQLLAGSSVIAHEFKWDLMDYLAGVPDAPVHSLGEIVERGLAHEAVMPTLRRAEQAEARETEAYLATLARREPLREAVVALMDAQRLDALVYPTIRTVPQLIGEPQRGSNCQLSAATGLPALSVPAGWTRGLPVGIELLGRPFDDARLVALGYALERAHPQRRVPDSTPPLTDGAAPGARTVEVRAESEDGDAELVARFEYDPLTSTLGYRVEVLGVDPADVYAVVLRHGDAGGRSAVVARLSGPERAGASGSFVLDADLRARLEAGELRVELLTRAQPFGAAAAPVTLAGGS
ncbi:MAG TPA: amidase family protein [Longimicrobiales bacterium]|nr:amidase family protein [Longimicrobiales bacterium]